MVRILYDGACPFCVNYVRFTRLRDRVGVVELIDAREAGEMVLTYAERGHFIDESFIVDTGDAVLTHGAALGYIHGKLAPRWTGLPYLTNARMLEAIYPSLRAMRNGTLRLLGTPPIQDPDEPLKRRPNLEEQGVKTVENSPARAKTP